MSKYKIEKYDWDRNHLNCFWNSGIIADITTKKGIFSISARGDINATLIAKTNFIDNYGNEIEKNKVLAYAKGEGNAFYQQMSDYIANDDELEQIISGEHPLYLLEVNNNNWLEMDLLNNDDEYEELDIVLDSYSLDDALKEAIEMIPSIINDLENEL